MSFWGESSSLLCAVFWATAVVLFRVAVRTVPPVELALFKSTFAFLLFLVTWLFFPAFEDESALSGRDIIVLILSGVVGIAMGDSLFLHSLKLLGASRNAILGCLFSPFVIILSLIFLGERFTYMKFLGFALILAGIFFAVYHKSENAITRNNLILGTITGVLSILCMASGMVITKPVVTDSSPILVAWIRLIGGAGGILCFTILTGKFFQMTQVFKSRLPWKVMIIGGFIGSYLALLTWLIGFKYTTASIASILNQTSVIFILLLAAVFLKERLSPLKIAGAVLSFAGVFLIFSHA
ncbi:MAG: DMT family transporter [Verrucomicrobia bacterium]|nr:DMT family transporter [Verrucomicrobiota bacterium]